MTNNGSSVNTTSNTTSGYDDPQGSWNNFGDEVTYSTNTLEAAVTVTTPEGSAS